MKILIIQTAFIGDVILATSLVEYAHTIYPDAEIHFLLRKGNESIVETSPHIKATWVWDKSQGKYKNLIKIGFKLRKEKFDLVLNIQRFFNSGLVSFLSGGKKRICFDKNPLSFLSHKKVKHLIPHKIDDHFLHEVQRNVLLLQSEVKNFSLPSKEDLAPKIYTTKDEQVKIHNITKSTPNYVVIAPASVWFTKQWNIENWTELKDKLVEDYHLYFIGAPSDKEFINDIIKSSKNCTNLSGKLSLRESAELMKMACRVFVNDSAPLHLASSVDAKVSAIFCSTTPKFGYGPIANDSKIIQVKEKLECHPCGLHGKKECPKIHFKCAKLIKAQELTKDIKKASL